LPDGTPIIVSGGGYGDETVRVWRLADGAPIGNPLTGHIGGVTALAVSSLPDGTPVIVSSAVDAVRVWRLADGSLLSGPLETHIGGEWAVAVGGLPDGTPVIVSGGGDNHTVQTQAADGSPLTGGTDEVQTLVVNGTPMFFILGGGEGTVRVWRLADGAPIGKPLIGHTDRVLAVAVGQLRDDTPVIVSGGADQTVRVWLLADGNPLGRPLWLSGSVKGITIHGTIIVTAARVGIAVHQLALLPVR
jgi:WD40 repeat protein